MSGKLLKLHILRCIYSGLFTLFLPLVFLRLWLRGIKLPIYRKGWSQRLGFVPFAKTQDVLWLHAVSVGESISAIPIITRFSKEHSTPIVVTTMTPTGSERIKSAFKQQIADGKILHCFIPYDLPWALNRFLNHINPKMLIIMETELWPNILSICSKRDIPVILANARLSPKSINSKLEVSF